MCLGQWLNSLSSQRRLRPVMWLLYIGTSVGITAIAVRSIPFLIPIPETELVQVNQAITLRDRHGQLLGTLLSRDQDHTMVVTLDDVAPVFIQAILATEDSQFYHHGPLDLQAIVRASRDSLRAGRIVSGASTVTMQLARMIQPSPRTVTGKLTEIWTAWRLGAGMDHDAILAAYVNRIPMGSNIYGVEAASQVYFGVSAADLTLAQASVLAALPNNPTYLNPYHYWEPMKKRQQYVLDRMVAEGWITQAEGDRAVQTELTLHPRQQGIIAAPHFLFWLADQLPDDHPGQVQTTLDRSLQQFVETQVRQVVRSLSDHNVQQGAALVIDNHTGDILAYVGSVDYFSQQHGQNNGGQNNGGQNDGVQALRQPGSTLKPFLYQLALEQRHLRPNTVLADIPTYYSIPGAKLYQPADYDQTFQGPVRVRLALANSLNIPAVRVLEQVGVEAFLQRLRDLGFRHLEQTPEHYGLGLALGSGEVSLWELAHAYVTLAHHGDAIALRPILHPNPNLDPNSTPSNAPVTTPPMTPPPMTTPPNNPSTWALVTHMLSDRHARARSFGVDSVLSLPFDAAVKTGTSSNFRDTWTVGFTTDYTVATWIGNFEGTPMQHVSGVSGAAPLWNRIMLHLHQHQDPDPLPLPESMVPGLVKRPICALSGLKPSPACPAIVEEYFFPEDLGAYERQVDTFYQTTASASGTATIPINHQPDDQLDDQLKHQPNYQLNLPSDYDHWLAQQSSPPVPIAQLTIVSPQNGDLFLTPSSVSSEAPRLEFKVVGPTEQPVEWWLNGQQLDVKKTGATSTVTNPTSYFWPMQAGTWTLEVKSGERRDRVQFEVSLPEFKQPSRGFSTTPP